MSSAKIKFFFRIIVQFLKKKFGFFECCPFGSKKLWTFFRNPPSFTSYFPVFTSHLPPFISSSLFSLRSSQFSRQTSQFSRPTSPLSYRTYLPYWECNTFFSLAHFVCFSATRIGASTRTRAPTSRTHRVLIFCLHPLPSPLTT